MQELQAEASHAGTERTDITKECCHPTSNSKLFTVRILFGEEPIETDENCEQLDHQLSTEILWNKPEDTTQRKNTDKEKFHAYQRTKSNTIVTDTKGRKSKFLLKTFLPKIRVVTKLTTLPIAIYQTQSKMPVLFYGKSQIKK